MQDQFRQLANCSIGLATRYSQEFPWTTLSEAACFLAPDDGVASSMTIDGHVLAQVPGQAPGWYQVNPTVDKPYKLNGSDGFSHVSLTPKSLSTSTAFVGAFRLPEGEPLPLPGSQTELASKFASIDHRAGPDPFSPSGLNVTLSAHTALVFEGKANLGAYSEAGLTAATGQFKDVTNPWTAAVNTEASIWASFQPIVGSTLEGSSWNHTVKATDVAVKTSNMGDHVRDVFSDAFSISLTNHADVAQSGTMHLSLNSSLNAVLNVSAVPEPSTWMMGVFGLVCLAGLQRCKHSKT